MNHDIDLCTNFCRRCGASAVAIAEGKRASACEPGVVGISHIRAVERIGSMFSLAPFADMHRLLPDDDGPIVA